MIPTIASTTLGESLDEKLKAAALAGFRAFELFDGDLEGRACTSTALRRMVEGSGLRLANLFPLRDFEGMPAERRSEALDRAARYLDFAAEVGAEMAMACSNVHPDSSPDPARIAADLHEAGDLAAARGLKLAYEALAWGRHVFDYRVAWDVVRRAEHPDVGLVLDSFHVLARRLDLAEIRRIPRERIFLVQISDAPWLDLGYLAWSRGHRTLPGRGALPLAEFVTALRATAYDGVVSLECFSDRLRAAPPAVAARKGYSALEALWSDTDPSPPAAT